MKVSRRDLIRIIREEAASQESKSQSRSTRKVNESKSRVQLSLSRMREIIREEVERAEKLQENDASEHIQAVNDVINRLNQLSPTSDANLPSQFREDMRPLDAATDRLSGPDISGATTFQSSSDQMADPDAKAHLISQARSLVADLRRLPGES